jgi:MFS family permease
VLSEHALTQRFNRFILGAFEASIAPSMLVIVAMWWTRREQPLRNNLWYSANGMATILGSLLSYGLAHAKSKLHPYQLIFLVCGLIAVVLSIPTMLILPRHPTRTRWLTDEQKYIALERIRLNNTGTQNQHFKWKQVIECFIDPKSWMWVIMSESRRFGDTPADLAVFCISLVSGGIGAFGRE